MRGPGREAPPLTVEDPSPASRDNDDASPSSPVHLAFADLRSRFEKLAGPSQAASSAAASSSSVTLPASKPGNTASLLTRSGPSHSSLHLPHAFNEFGARQVYSNGNGDQMRGEEMAIEPSLGSLEAKPAATSSRRPPPPRPPKPTAFSRSPSAIAKVPAAGLSQLDTKLELNTVISTPRPSTAQPASAPPRIDARVPPPPPLRDVSLSSFSDVSAALQWADDPGDSIDTRNNDISSNSIPIPPPPPRRVNPTSSTILSPPPVLSPETVQSASPRPIPAPPLPSSSPNIQRVAAAPRAVLQPPPVPSRSLPADAHSFHRSNEATPSTSPLPPPLRSAVLRTQGSSTMTRGASNSSAAVGDSSSSDDEDDLEIPVASSSLSLASSSAAANSARLPATTAPPPLAYSTADTLPDASRANRRPPFFSPRRYATSKHVTCSAVAGHTICLASGDKVRVYRVGPTATSTSEKLCSLVAEKGGKEVKITTMAFRPDERDEGRFLWCGTKEGQIWEMDIAYALVTNVRQNVHTAPVVLMERMGGDMLTMDESGKICIWSAAKEKGHLDLARQPVSQRIALEKAAVVLALGHQLWVCAGGGGVGVTSPPLSASGVVGGGLAGGIHSASAAVAGIGSNGHRSSSQSHTKEQLRIKILNPTSLTQPFHATSRPIGLGDMAKASSSGPIGAISCGTVLQSDPSRAYVGHDSGHISVWDRKKMICVAVQKLNVLGFTALCGVGTFLWAGNRSGRITVYQPSYLEGQHWQVIKSWPAHKHGVNAIWVDTTALREGGGGNQASDEADALALPVASAGMDYRVEIWDGTLTHDYIAHRLAKRVGEFSTYRRLRSLHITFNIDAAPASALNGSVTAMDWLPQVLASSNAPPDLIYIGFQEVVDLEDKSLTAKSMLLNATKGKSRAKAQVNERISHQYREWQSRLIQSIRLAMPPDVPYTTVHTETLVGLLSCMFVRSDQMHSVRDVGLSTIKCGLGGRWGNKGAILSRVTIDDTSCCFINAHLAAGQKHVKQRNADVAQIMEAEALPASISDGSDGGGAVDADVVYVSGGDGQLVLDHELVFLGGDLNYRIDLPRSQVINAIERRDWPLLQERDQLTLELRKNAPTFRLRGFREAGEKEWGPTYKFDRGSGTYDSSEKKRAPAWCDRLLYRDALAGEDESSTPRVKCLQYRSWPELQISDHRPVSCVYEFQVKRVDREKREVVRIEEAARGQGKIRELLEEARRFYASVATT